MNAAEVRTVQDYIHTKDYYEQVHIYSVIAKSQAGNTSQIYNNTKRPKSKENQLGILEISSMEFMHFDRNSAKSLASGEGTTRVTYLSTLRKLPHLSPKSCPNFTK